MKKHSQTNLLTLILLSGIAAAQEAATSLGQGAAPTLLSGAICDEAVRAFDTQPGPEGGALHVGGYFSTAMVGPTDTIAFYGRVEGLDRNQGVFIADPNGVRAIALGSGWGLGSGVPGPPVGDPTPIGGRFTGFPAVSVEPPDPWPAGSNMLIGDSLLPTLNATGDIVFLADVAGGTAARGLFFYRAATQQIEKVAAFGDSVPGGGTLSAISHASMNDKGSVVFLGIGASSTDEMILRWHNGTLSMVARVGDPSPTPGETYGSFGGGYGYGLPDGTYLPLGNLPDVNNRDSVAFTAFFTVPTGYHGAVVDKGSGGQWYAQWGDGAPGGGQFQFFWDVILNNDDEIAFCNQYSVNPPLQIPAWFVGSPDSFRKAIEVGEVLATGERVLMIAASHNPMNPLTDDGDLALWVATGIAGQAPSKEVVVLSRADDSRATLFCEGDVSRLGPAEHIAAWPSLNRGGQLTLSHGVSGAAQGVESGHLLMDLCPEVRTYCTAGTSSIGCMPALSHTGVPSATASSGFTVAAGGLEGQKLAILFYGISGTASLPGGGTNTLCVQPPLQRTIPQVTSGASGTCSGSYVIDMNAYFANDPTSLGQPVFPGQHFAAQAWSRDSAGAVLSDGIEFWLAP